MEESPGNAFSASHGCSAHYRSHPSHFQYDGADVFCRYGADDKRRTRSVMDEIPSLVAAPGYQPADLDHYVELRKTVHSAAELLSKLQPTYC